MKKHYLTEVQLFARVLLTATVELIDHLQTEIFYGGWELNEFWATTSKNWNESDVKTDSSKGFDEHSNEFASQIAEPKEKSTYFASLLQTHSLLGKSLQLIKNAGTPVV